MGDQLQGPGGEEGERRHSRVHKLLSDGFSRKVKSEWSEKGKTGMAGEEKLI